jgi:hypothetical protein
LMPLAGRSRVDESRCHTGYTGHFSLIGTYFRLRAELTDRMLILNQPHQCAVLAEHVRHYNGRRPHRAPASPIPTNTRLPAPATTGSNTVQFLVA